MNHFESSVINLIWTKKLVLLYLLLYMIKEGFALCQCNIDFLSFTIDFIQIGPNSAIFVQHFNDIPQ
jgi:hypothetical protein